MTTSDETIAYLADVLRMNPVHESDEILARRRHFLGTAPDAAGIVDAEEDRERVQSALRAVRETFWKQDPTPALAGLRALPLERYPDLNRSFARLERAAAARDRILALAGEPKVHPLFMDYLRSIVLATPREAARLRAEAESRLATKPHVLRARKSERLLDSSYPELHALAPEWLDSIRRLPVERGLTKEVAKNSWWIIIAVYILIKVLIALFRRIDVS